MELKLLPPELKTPVCNKEMFVRADPWVREIFWRDGRVVYCIGLENRRAERFQPFESVSLRQFHRGRMRFNRCKTKADPARVFNLSIGQAHEA